MVESKDIGKCKLCGRDAKISESHIIPKFAVDWLKRTSATGYIRQATEPNLRLQDGHKAKLLCAECERLFSIWEKRFAEDLFIPFQEKGRKSFVYDDWLLSFAVSLAWRTGMHISSFPTDKPEIKPELANSLNEAMNCWRAFLRRQSEDVGPYEHHLLFLSAITNEQGVNLPDRFNMYLLRSVDIEIAHTSTEVFVYTKLPGLIFWCFIEPPHSAGLEGTRIYHQGTIELPQRLTRLELGNFIMDRAKFVNQMPILMSSKQHQKVVNDLLKDPEHTRASHTFEVIQHDIFRKSNKRKSK